MAGPIYYVPTRPPGSMFPQTITTTMDAFITRARAAQPAGTGPLPLANIDSGYGMPRAIPLGGCDTLAPGDPSDRRLVTMGAELNPATFQFAVVMAQATGPGATLLLGFADAASAVQRIPGFLNTIGGNPAILFAVVFYAGGFGDPEFATISNAVQAGIGANASPQPRLVAIAQITSIVSVAPDGSFGTV